MWQEKKFTMAKKAEKKSPDILTAYMTHCLEAEKTPQSVYKFCKDLGIEETDFYAHYGSLDAVKHSIWETFYTNTKTVIEKDAAYASLSRKDRLLTFYYTFFEVLLLNRSYVLFSFSGEHSSMQNWAQLKTLRSAVKSFAEELIEEGNEEKSRFSQNSVPVFSEAVWAQLMFVLKFWIKDSSKGFEKTDALIEKSVQAAFEVFDNTSVDTLVDLGKFLWKEITNKA